MTESWKPCQERDTFQRTSKSAFRIELGRNQSETGIPQKHLKRELYIVGAVLNADAEADLFVIAYAALT